MSVKKVLSIAEQLAREGATMSDVSFIGQPVSRNKWGNTHVETEDGGKFDSKLEYATWRDLKARERAGEIEGLQRQVGYSIWVLGVWVCDYIADFVFIEGGAQIVADAKGRPTPEYILKRRLMRAAFGVTIREYTDKGVAPPAKFRTQK